MHTDIVALEAFFGNTRAAEFDSVRVEHEFISSLERNTDPVIMPLYGNEIAHSNDFVAVIVDSSECDNALLVVVVGDPTETAPRIIILPKRRIFNVEFI